MQVRVTGNLLASPSKCLTAGKLAECNNRLVHHTAAALPQRLRTAAAIKIGTETGSTDTPDHRPPGVLSPPMTCRNLSPGGDAEARMHGADQIMVPTLEQDS